MQIGNKIGISRISLIANIVRSLLLLCLFGSILTDTALARSLEVIRKTNEIRLCVAGSSHELYAAMGLAFAEGMGIPAKVKQLESWDRQFHNAEGVTVRDATYTPELMVSGECDCYPNDMVMNDWRLQKLDFVILFQTRMVVVVHKDRLSGIKGIADLAGKTAAIQKGTSYHTWIDGQNASTLSENPITIEFMPTDASMQAVDTGIVDFTVIGADGALNWTRNKVKNSVVAFPIGTPKQLGWAFRKEDKDLQAAVHKFFESQAITGSRFDKIWSEKVGIALSDFTLFITNLLQD
ncbi:hypothetical protein MTBBW1_1310007 [Desulfamplus magnetovallimortis]|uniref:Solute-binding protein family 3/N-terminal domain-containing protein n=1 Tax=Desulfamplus magnetovallimortis TaxID=1246637 RepID=A0A1W1H774_9BACT|nr:transporter substrate-binding domain-containing protein [Desulfamplus magnetovallimortis]SLM28309.1 hypothetical protein MTBBW1_1310007 [Desulfamplus magnetovallimortis]